MIEAHWIFDHIFLSSFVFDHLSGMSCTVQTHQNDWKCNFVERILMQIKWKSTKDSFNWKLRTKKWAITHIFGWAKFIAKEREKAASSNVMSISIQHASQNNNNVTYIFTFYMTMFTTICLASTIQFRYLEIFTVSLLLLLLFKFLHATTNIPMDFATIMPIIGM